MARILYTGIVSELRGSIAGTTFQHNASGRIAKGRSNQKFSSSGAQSTTQSKFVAIVNAYRDLSIEDKLAWNALALANPRIDKWGRAKTLSGYQYFVANNRNLNTIGLPFQNTPASYVSPITVPPFSIVLTSSQMLVYFSPAFDTLTGHLLVFASAPCLTVTATSRIPRYLIAITAPGTYTYLDTTSEYEAKFNLVYADLYTSARCFINFFICSVEGATGLTSMFTYANNSLNI